MPYQRAIFDIETAPYSEATLEMTMPTFEAPSNYKDPEKIKAYVEEKRREYVDRAALSPMTARVLAIGTLFDGQFELIHSEDEKVLLQQWWGTFRRHRANFNVFVGFNIETFDIPFLLKRSWILGVEAPANLFIGNRFLDGETFIDLRKVWACGDRDARGSLNDLFVAFGLPPKTDSGKNFHKLWQSERDKAIAYNRGELEGMARLADRMLGRETKPFKRVAPQDEEDLP